MTEADELRKEMKSGQLETKEQNREQYHQLTQLIQEMALNQKKSSEEAKEDIGLVIQRQDTMEKRLDKLEAGGAAKGDHTFIGQHKLLIDKARYGIKVLKMRGKVSELSARTHLKTQLDLTKATMDNMGITQAYRLGKNPVKENDPCPPVIIVFNLSW